MTTAVDIAFDCLPLRSIGRIDIPLDASPGYRSRCERLQQALEAYPGAYAYYLYNTHCVYRLANSDIENMLRFTFEGVLLTDLSDARADRADLNIELVSETCGSLSEEVLAWFRKIVTQAVLIEFNHFIAAGHLASRVENISKHASIHDITDFAGKDV